MHQEITVKVVLEESQMSYLLQYIWKSSYGLQINCILPFRPQFEFDTILTIVHETGWRVLIKDAVGTCKSEINVERFNTITYLFQYLEQEIFRFTIEIDVQGF